MNDQRNNSFDEIFTKLEIYYALVPTALSCGVSIYGYIIKKVDIYSLLSIACSAIAVISIIFLYFLLRVIVKSAQKTAEQNKELLKAQLEAEKAKAFDYKMYAPLDSPSVKKILEKYGLNFFSLKRGEKMIGANDKEYIKLKTLLKKDSVFGKDFQCLPVRNDKKWGNCIIQVSFIPMDKEENIPLILRMPFTHSRDAIIREKKSNDANFTFVSFSPVPLRYGEDFDILKCYNREVPNRHVPTKFEEVGCTLKYESTENKNERIYLFYMIKVHYKDVCFFDENGSFNMETIKNLFAFNTEVEQNKLEYFRKDHDIIISAAKSEDIYNALSKDGDRNSLPEYLKKLFDNEKYVVKFYDQEIEFDLRNGKLGKVELPHIQRMRSQS